MDRNPHCQLGALSMSWRVLITGFLLVLCAGYLSGALNAALSVGITPAAIADHYGDQSLTEAEQAMIADQGFVEEEFSFDDEPSAPMGGHDMGSMDHEAHGDKTPMSITAQQMAQLAHVHLLGFAMILLSTGAIACLTGYSETVKTVIVGLLFLSLVGDIGGLYLVRFVSAELAVLNMMAGVTIGVCLAFTVIRAFWEMWGPRTQTT